MQSLPKSLPCFLCYPTCLIISRNFHCGAIIPSVKLFWWVSLELTINAKCKPEQSQRVLLKLESCCDAMKGLFSTAIKAGQHNVPAQEVFLEENGCNKGGCSACVSSYHICSFVVPAHIFFNQTLYRALIQTGPYSSTGARYFQSKIIHKNSSIIGHHVGFNILNE